MFAQVISALMRALMVAAIVALPALAVPALDGGTGGDGTQTVVLVALVAGLLIFLEYSSAYPSFVEFRYAPPINRLWFAALAVTVIFTTAIFANGQGGGTFSALLTSIARLFSGYLDMPFSPVRAMVLMLPPDAPAQLVSVVRTMAGFAYALSLFVIVLFFVMIRVLDWPVRNGAFNVWINLPLFDPTVGHDVVRRLRQHARVNLLLGFLLPFVLPAIGQIAAGWIDPLTLNRPLTLIWAVTLWAILPASIMIRGMAIGRVADMIQQKRDRAYAAQDQEYAL